MDKISVIILSAALLVSSIVVSYPIYSLNQKAAKIERIADFVNMEIKVIKPFVHRFNDQLSIELSK